MALPWYNIFNKVRVCDTCHTSAPACLNESGSAN
jgi:hypothetical protein